MDQKIIGKILNEIKFIIYSIGYILLIEFRNRYDDDFNQT